MMTPANTIYFSRLLQSKYPHIAREIVEKLKEHSITPKWLDHTNDVWARDYMPLQLNDNYFVHYTYYPDYLMGKLEDRASITNPVRLEQQLLIAKDKVVVNLPLIMDGGNAVITDKHIVMTEKVLVENRRSNYDNAGAITRQIIKKTKLEPIFILWDAKNEKYGHTDWLVRYMGGDSNIIVVAMNEPATMDVSKSAIKELEETGHYDIRLFRLSNPTKNSWAYLNYVQVNNVVLMPSVAEPDNDREAKNLMQQLFKDAGQDVIIETIDCQDLIKDGGALHCVSWNIHI